MICDVTHNMKEKKQGTMALVKCAVELFTITQKPSEFIDDYCKIFIAKNYPIDAHSGQAGRHEMLYSETHTQIMTAQNVDETGMITNAARRSKIEAEALKSSSEAFLAFLFILVADNTTCKSPSRTSWRTTTSWGRRVTLPQWSRASDSSQILSRRKDRAAATSNKRTRRLL